MVAGLLMFFARYILVLIAAYLSTFGSGRIPLVRNSRFLGIRPSRTAASKPAHLHSNRRFNRGEEFISVFLLFRWRQVPCLRIAARAKPPDKADPPVTARAILPIAARYDTSRWKTAGFLPS